MSIEILALECSGDVIKEARLEVTLQECIGQGTFGKVYKALISILRVKNGNIDKNEKIVVAIKQIRQKSHIAQRELHILRQLNHPNIVILKYYYFEEESSVSYLNLVLDYIPNTLHDLYIHYIRTKGFVPLLFIKVIMFQLLRGLAYIHYKCICHRDIKPHNLLVQTPRNILKIADFGSAKNIISGEPNIAYICSRFYRAPELVLGSTSYSYPIDIWSSGCVLAELLAGKPFFTASSSVDLICEMAKVLGTPTKDDLNEINPAFCAYSFPIIPKKNWYDIFPDKNAQNLVALLSEMLVFSPSKRINSQAAVFHTAFTDLIEQFSKSHNEQNQDMPPDFVKFTSEEILFCPKYKELELINQQNIKNQ